MSELSAPVEDLGIILAAGGSGSRYGSGNKLLEMLAGCPVFTHALKRFAGLCRNGALVLVVPESELPVFRDFSAQFCPSVDLIIVPGGKTRGESVRHGLDALPAWVRYVAIHDAARPLLTASMLLDCLASAREHDGAIVARPVTDTLKRGSADGMIEATVDRSVLWAVETPQIFELAKLRRAYELTCGQEFTDDGGVMEAAGYRIRLFRNTEPNIKITYARDLAVASALLQAE